jgi:hypothetical protein
MDGLGIQLAVLSLPNDVESILPAAQRRAFARQINTTARQAVDDHPGRFGFFAHLPTPTDVDAALEADLYPRTAHRGARGKTGERLCRVVGWRIRCGERGAGKTPGLP